jgi:hypothetical protein
MIYPATRRPSSHDARNPVQRTERQNCPPAWWDMVGGVSGMSRRLCFSITEPFIRQDVMLKHNLPLAHSAFPMEFSADSLDNRILEGKPEQGLS